MTTATSILLRYADRLTLWLAPRLSRLPPHVRASLATAVALALGATGVTITGDEAAVIATGAIYVLGGIVDAVVSWRAKRIAERADRRKVVIIKPDVVLLFAVAFGLAGCAHWSATVQRAGIEAATAGRLEYLAGRGLEGSGLASAGAGVDVEVCRGSRCVPVSVTVEASGDAAHVIVCASVWGISTCEVVP